MLAFEDLCYILMIAGLKAANKKFLMIVIKVDIDVEMGSKEMSLVNFVREQRN